MFINIISMVLLETTVFMLPTFSPPEKSIPGQNKVKLIEFYLDQE